MGLWALSLGSIALLLGTAHTLTQMGGFFTQAALLTFGGAYAVLPFVTQAAVEQYGWLSAAQMMDGLALGESTPGPLIMVVAYVGFVGGYVKAVLGPDSLFLAGAFAVFAHPFAPVCPPLCRPVVSETFLTFSQSLERRKT